MLKPQTRFSRAGEEEEEGGGERKNFMASEGEIKEKSDIMER